MRMNIGRLSECNGMMIKIDMHHFVNGSSAILGNILIIVGSVVRDESLLIKPRKLALSTKMSADGDDADRKVTKARNEIFMVRFDR